MTRQTFPKILASEEKATPIMLATSISFKRLLFKYKMRKRDRQTHSQTETDDKPIDRQRYRRSTGQTATIWRRQTCKVYLDYLGRIRCNLIASLSCRLTFYLDITRCQYPFLIESPTGNGSGEVTIQLAQHIIGVIYISKNFRPEVGLRAGLCVYPWPYGSEPV